MQIKYKQGEQTSYWGVPVHFLAPPSLQVLPIVTSDGIEEGKGNSSLVIVTGPQSRE